MPVPDPVPSPRHSTMRRFLRIFRLLALLATVIAALAGIGFTVLVGTGLMTLVFLSNSSGHDEAAAHFNAEKDKG